MPTSPLARVTGTLVALEGVGIAALTVWEIVALVRGDSGSIDSSVALIVLSALGAAAVIAFGVAVWRGRSWGRSGGIVVQLLILAVALGAATGAFAEPAMALAIAAPAVVVFVLLVLTVREAGREARREPEDQVSR